MASVSDRASASERSIPSSVSASSATSSSASGLGTWRRASRVSAISLDAAVSAVIGAIAPRAIITPANSARAVPPSTPKIRNSCTRERVSLGSDKGRPY